MAPVEGWGREGRPKPPRLGLGPRGKGPGLPAWNSLPLSSLTLGKGRSSKNEMAFCCPRPAKVYTKGLQDW